MMSIKVRSRFRLVRWSVSRSNLSTAAAGLSIYSLSSWLQTVDSACRRPAGQRVEEKRIFAAEQLLGARH